MNKETKEAAFKRAKNRCEQCGEPGDRSNWELHVHHLTYERYGHERLSDVLVLCLRCHGRAHPRHEFIPRDQQLRRAEMRRARRALLKKQRRERYASRNPKAAYPRQSTVDEVRAESLERLRKSRRGEYVPPFTFA